MTDYKQLGLKYLRANISRCIITIIGVVMTVIVLYGGLNAAYSYFLKEREDIRAANDYEFVLMIDDKSVATTIAQDDRIAKAYIGSYEYYAYYDAEENHLYKNALYATGRNPYKMLTTMNELCQDYDVQGELNYDLAIYYFQAEDDGSGVIVTILVILLIAYIFAIFAVGIIRNTIQMFMLEQVKDYGILRCVGCTKKQLRRIIYVMGAVQEVIGLIIGIVLGGFITYIIGVFLGVDMGYHVIPMIPVIIAYLGDLYLLIRENAKLVVNMPPISAVKGQFRIKKEKIRRRGKGLMGHIFGVEGEYARKNVLRNKGRFVKTVAALSVSIAGSIAVLSIYGTTDNIKEYICELSGDYQLEFCYSPTLMSDIEDVEADLPSADTMKYLSQNDAVLESRKVYMASVYASDPLEFYSSYTDDFIDKTVIGNMAKTYVERTTEEGDDYLHASAQGLSLLVNGGMVMTGLSDEELSELDKYLVDGTTDVSDHGIVIVVAAGYEMQEEDEYRYYDFSYNHVQQNTYQVGDTIDIVNTQLLYERVSAALDKLKKEHELESGSGDTYDNSTYISDRYKTMCDVYQQLVDEKEYTTYTVEGILDMGNQVNYSWNMCAFTSLDNYFAETGYDSSQISGIKYKLDVDKLTASQVYTLESYCEDFSSISFIYLFYIVLQVRSFIKYVLIAVVFIFLLSSVNIINTTAGSIHMRRKEFAQLRVIGMSREKLMKTVMLEGVMTIVISNIIGGIMGTAVYYLEYYYMYTYVTNLKFSPGIWVYIVGLVASATLILGSIYFPLRKLPQGMAEDLSLEE